MSHTEAHLDYLDEGRSSHLGGQSVMARMAVWLAVWHGVMDLGVGYGSCPDFSSFYPPGPWTAWSQAGPAQPMNALSNHRWLPVFLLAGWQVSTHAVKSRDGAWLGAIWHSCDKAHAFPQLPVALGLALAPPC